MNGWANREARGVQELAPEAEPPRRPVLRVADHRMADRLQVDADLVRTAGLEPHSKSVVRGSASATSKCVTASRGASVSVDIRVRTRRSRPIGASIVPVGPAGGPRRARRTRA